MGLTLVELLVVLVILATLTVIAVQATDGLMDQGRYDSTQRILQNVDEAIISPMGQRDSDGSLFISGFVADIGRPPKVIGSDPLTQLQELWSNPNGLAPYSLQGIAIDLEVKVMCGWRAGGYLRMTPAADGTIALQDSWRRPFVLAFNTTSGYLESISSGGSNGTINVTDTGFDTDLHQVIDPTRFSGVMSGTVSLLDTNGQPRDTDPADTSALNTVLNPADSNTKMVVNLYGPDPVTGQPKFTNAVVKRLGTGTYSYEVATTIGPRLLRAYEKSTTPKRSRIASLVVPAGGRTQPITIQP